HAFHSFPTRRSSDLPLVDVQNTAARNLISRDLIEAVPTNKTLAAWASLTPGLGAGATAMDVGGSKGEQSIRLAIHGGRGSEQRIDRKSTRLNSSHDQ